MAAVLTVLRLSNDDDDYTVEGTIALSGSYPAAGEPIDFTKMVFPPGALLPARLAPVYAVAQGSTGDDYCFLLNSALNTPYPITGCFLVINTASATLLSAGAYNSRFTTDFNIGFVARFAKQQ
jgi:hypothetical protein